MWPHMAQRIFLAAQHSLGNKSGKQIPPGLKPLGMTKRKDLDAALKRRSTQIEPTETSFRKL